MTSRNVAGSYERCYARVLVPLGTSVAVPDRGDPLPGPENWKPPPMISWPSSSPTGAPDQSGRGREDRHLKFYATRENLSKTTALPTSNRPASPPSRVRREHACFHVEVSESGSGRPRRYAR